MCYMKDSNQQQYEMPRVQHVKGLNRFHLSMTKLSILYVTCNDCPFSWKLE